MSQNGAYNPVMLIISAIPITFSSPQAGLLSAPRLSVLFGTTIEINGRFIDWLSR